LIFHKTLRLKQISKGPLINTEGGREKGKGEGKRECQGREGNKYSLSLSLLGWLEKIQRKGFIEVDPSVMKKFKIMCHISFSHFPSFPFLLKIGRKPNDRPRRNEFRPHPVLSRSSPQPNMRKPSSCLFSLPLPVPLSFLLTKQC